MRLLKTRWGWVLPVTICLLFASAPAAHATPVLVEETDFEIFRLAGDFPPGHPSADPNFKWGAPTFGTPGGLVSFSFMAAGTDCSALSLAGIGCTTLLDLTTEVGAGYDTHFADQMAKWSAVANIDFVQVADGGQPVNAPGAGDIRVGVGNFTEIGPGVLAFAFFPRPAGPFPDIRGDIFFNAAFNWEFVSDGTADGAFDFRLVALHEIGHAIGLGHQPSAESQAIMNPIYNEALGLNLLADDIAGAIYIYGARQTPPVPEPATLLLLGTAFAGYGWQRRRRMA